MDEPRPMATRDDATVAEAEPPTLPLGTPVVERVAEVIRDAFATYHAEFNEITRRAKSRFEQCDWHGMQRDAEQRLDLYKGHVARAIAAIEAELGDSPPDPQFWPSVKKAYSALIEHRPDIEIAESFYNSVTMRTCGAHGVDRTIQYVGSEFDYTPSAPEQPPYRVYSPDGDPTTRGLITRILKDCRFEVPYRNLDSDAQLAADQIDGYIASITRSGKIECVEVAASVFYRGKGAYLVGCICTTSLYVPLVIALFNDSDGVYVDAVLLTEDEVSIVFSFARSYFHVELDKPSAMVRFLKSIMPLKPVAELYISLGYNKHGKTELYRDLVRHLNLSTDRFEIAPGERGMVMMVFTLHSYDVVFKVIKDRFDYPKTSTRDDVINRYHLVFRHDRGGRLVDAQEFEHLRFEKARFAPDLLEELLRVAAHTVSVEGDEVVIKHLYTERRLTPLDMYIRNNQGGPVTDAVIDYGQSIKDLAATNIFPGDILLKNFGVTRHGRVVFYDYDELCLLTDCNFRQMPEASDSDEDLMAEPWFSVGEQDVFPEELNSFLGMPPDLTRTFREHHGELFGVNFWDEIQARHRAGEVMEILPYRESRHLRKG